MTFPLDANTVRDYMDLEPDGTSKYSNTTINSNIRAAVTMLERKTGRVFGDTTATYAFTTGGRTSLIIPGLREATTVELNGATLAADSGYYLQPDAQQTGVSTGLAFGGYRRGDYHSNPEWFDRGLDFGLDGYRYASGGSVPSDLRISGTWGYEDPPEPVLMAVKILAAYLTRLPVSNEAGAVVLPGGSQYDLVAWPAEVRDFVSDWSILAGIEPIP